MIEHGIIMITEDCPVVLICPCNKYPVRDIYPGYLLSDSWDSPLASQVAELLNASPLCLALLQGQRS
ncbi:hypothetical protein ES703_75140 [subsurface metagenome]